MTKNLTLLSRVSYARFFVGARDDIIKERFDSAMIKVDKIFQLYKSTQPSADVPIQVNIMCGLVAWNLRNFDLVYQCCNVALNQIKARLNNEEKEEKINDLRYMKGYCKNLIAFSDADGGINADIDFSDLQNLRHPDYNLSKVSGLLKRTFPIDDTDWWCTGS